MMLSHPVTGFDDRPTEVMKAANQLARVILEGKLWKCPEGMRMGWSHENANTELETYMIWRRTYDPSNEIHPTAERLVRQLFS
jgi:hypothetical protein